jgi:transcriptional antiterminator RfaH
MSEGEPDQTTYELQVRDVGLLRFLGKVMSFWAIVQTETQREHTARLMLMRQGFETYMPRIRIKADRIGLLFPTYIFCRIIDRWYSARWTIGVTRILMDSERPARVPDAIIEAIRKQEVGGFVKLPKQDNEKRPGEKVKIIRGSFEGQIAIWEGMSGKERERVLLELLGQMVPVELPSRDVTGLDDQDAFRVDKHAQR